MKQNRINIKYQRGDFFANDNINIDIKNTSTSALHLLQKQIENISLKCVIDDHPVNQAYCDLLKNLL